jgi:DNA recombination protein RmuC
MDPLGLLVGLVAGLIISGGAAAWVVRWLHARQAALEHQAAEQARLLAEAHTTVARQTAEIEHLQRTLADRQATLRTEFENLANRLLEDKGRALAAEQRSGLELAVAPLRDRIKEFEEKVNRTYDAESRDRAALLDLLKRVDLGQVRLGKEAESLSRALTGQAKVQGDWGEMILENLLNAVGLVEGREYAVQQSHTGEDGARLRPDVVLYLPEDKAVVVDSKVAITAFVAAGRAEDPAERERWLDEHVAAVRNHLRDLAQKRYQDTVPGRTLDFVIAFIPVEAAFHAALARDPGLYEEAHRKGIVLASPTTLLATLRVVAHVWLHERQNANAQKIAAEAGKLLDKLVGFTRDLHGLGERLGQAQAAYADACAKLETGRGNVIAKAKALVRLGAKPARNDELMALGSGDDD